MARDKNEWAQKVFTLVKLGNTTAAMAQVKVAPSVGDVTRLQKLLAALPASSAQQQFDKAVAAELDLLAAPRLHRSP